MLYIFFGMKIYIANSQEFIAYTLMYMLSATMIQSYVFGRFRWPWISDVYEYIQSVMLFRAVISVFLDPRNPKFEVTAKGQTLDDNRLSGIALPYFAIFGLVAASMVVLGFRYANEPNARDLITVVGVWTGLNLFLTGIGLGAVCELRERRSVPRVASNLKATLVVGTEVIPVIIENMCFGGLQVRIPGTAQLPARATGVLRIADAGAPNGFLETPMTNIGRRTLGEGRGAGLKFYGFNGDRFRIIAKVVFSDIAPVYANRNRGNARLGLLRGTAVFAAWWLSQTARGLYYALFRRGAAGAARVGSSAESSAA
jgi:cellulose synthase (UDP-forming)